MILKDIVLVGCLAVSVGLPARASAQLSAGDRVRAVVAGSDPKDRTVIVGNLVALHDDSFRIHTAESSSISIPQESIERIERSLGLSRRKTAMRIAPLTIALGVGIGLWNPLDEVVGRTQAVMTGVGAGIVSAAITGALFPFVEAWEEVQ